MASRKEQKAAARERLRQEMERKKKRARRNRVIAITAGAMVLVVAAVVIGIFVQRERNEDAQARANENAVPKQVDELAIPVGDADAPVTLTVYEDFRCPACKQFEKTYGTTISKLVEQGKLQVEYHVASIIDANFPGTNGSRIAGNAAVCANEVGKFVPYHKVLFDNQPPEQQDAFTTQRVLELAENVNGLADNSKFTECVKQDKYRSWLRKVQAEFDTRFNGKVSTPSLILDGEVMMGGNRQQVAQEMATPAQFEQTVNKRAANGGAGGDDTDGSGRPVPPHAVRPGS